MFFLLSANQNAFANPEKSYRTELYLGINIPGGGEVSGDDWNQFVDNEITSRFPDGFLEIQNK